MDILETLNIWLHCLLLFGYLHVPTYYDIGINYVRIGFTLHSGVYLVVKNL